MVSGINNGPNMGDDTLYWHRGSRHGRLSVRHSRHRLFPVAAVWLWANLTRPAWRGKSSSASLSQKPRLLNVNIPAIPYEQLQGLAATRLASAIRVDARDPRPIRGREIF